MKQLFQLSLISLSLIGVSSSQLLLGDCALCESVREYNREHPQKFEYYEDYLKDQENNKELPKNKTEEKTEKS